MEELFKGYYMGIITCSKEYYSEITEMNEREENPQRKIRYIGGVCREPFDETDEIQATRVGVPTIVYQRDGLYYDLLYSLYEDELCYGEEENELGISLTHVEPFLDWNPDFLMQFCMQGIALLTQNKKL